jgi:hypothetical protein
MTADANLFVAIAEVAGVFVGFGALISVIRHGEIHWSQLALIRALVTIGLVVIVGSLLPVVLAQYGLEDHALWAVSSAVFLVLNWANIVRALRSPENREIVVRQARRSPLAAAVFWILLELPIQVPLLLAVLGVNPDLDVAFYLTALAFNLFQAAFILVQVVYAQVSDPQAREPGA